MWTNLQRLRYLVYSKNREGRQKSCLHTRASTLPPDSKANDVKWQHLRVLMHAQSLFAHVHLVIDSPGLMDWFLEGFFTGGCCCFTWRSKSGVRPNSSRTTTPTPTDSFDFRTPPTVVITIFSTLYNKKEQVPWNIIKPLPPLLSPILNACINFNVLEAMCLFVRNSLL